ncbi:MAG: acetyl-CoA hydrolase/transferase C-terminal domain-containing protein [Dehalococcoidia bacterium]|jgi:4-hydroxybutyrate CoA-transferase|nr:acetyl-CoA hydrolase/transferase C-terminal domain-containing protein [Dehalococcoidia bacterium]
MRHDFTGNWRDHYDSRVMSAEQAASLVQSGDHIWIPPGHGSPVLLAAIAARTGDLSDVEIRGLGVPDGGLFSAEAAQSFRYQDQFGNVFSRPPLEAKVIDYHPYWLVGGHKALDAGREDGWAVDNILITVSEPDSAGFVSVGCSVWDSITTSRRAKRVIAAVSPNTRHTFGDTVLHVSEIEAFVPDDRPAAALEMEYDPIDEAIADHVNELISDGDTVQIGVGSHTAGMIHFGLFQGKQELSYYGELTVRGLVPMVEQGIFTGRTSRLHPGKFVATVVGNTAEEREVVFGNRAFELYGTEYLVDPRNIARNEGIVAINGALTVDLSGQIGAYTIGPRIYAGMGGHLAFALGAFLAPRGRYVCVVPSTAANGTVSTISAQFDPGQVVSVPREIADTVVTEHGVARLLGKSVRQRAGELISVAHPDFRGELKKEADRLFYP